MTWTLLCLLCLMQMQQTRCFCNKHGILFTAGFRKFLPFQFEFPLWIFSPHKTFDDGSKRWYAVEIAEYLADMLTILTPTKLITWNRRKNREWSPKTPTVIKKRNTVKWAVAAWVRTPHGCLDTYRRRATIAMWTQVLYVTQENLVYQRSW